MYLSCKSYFDAFESDTDNGDQGIRNLTSWTLSANDISASDLRLISSNSSGPETNTFHLSIIGTLKALP